MLRSARSKGTLSTNDDGACGVDCDLEYCSLRETVPDRRPDPDYIRRDASDQHVSFCLCSRAIREGASNSGSAGTLCAQIEGAGRRKRGRRCTADGGGWNSLSLKLFCSAVSISKI